VTLANIKAMMKKGGWLVMNELAKTELFTTLTFGLLDGWWLYEDEELRLEGSPGLGAESWETVLLESGFDRIASYPEGSGLAQQIVVAQSNGNISIKRPNLALPAKAAAIKTQLSSGTAAKTVAGRLLAIAADTIKLPVEEFDIDASFSEYGFDSILGTTLIKNINEELNISLRPVDLFNHQSIQELADYISETFDDLSLPGEQAPPEEIIAVQQPPASALQDIPRLKDSRARFTAEVREHTAPQATSPAVPSTLTDMAVIGYGGAFPGDSYSLKDAAPVLTTKHSKQNWHSLDDSRIEAYIPETGMKRSEAELMGRQHRLVFGALGLAMKQGGLTREDLSGSRTGVFIAAAQVSGHRDENREYLAEYNLAHMIPAKISFFFDLRGPSEVINVSCASSYAALDRAVQSIRAGDCDQAIVGGVNIITELTSNFAGHVDLMALLSSKGMMLSFSNDADGFVRSEGVGVVILKGKEQAQRDHNRIFALVKGTSFVHAGKNISWDSPNPRGIREVISKSLQRANVSADTIDFIEAHGVANRIADVIELEAISNAYRELSSNPSKKWPVSSVKPLVGHSELASGMASLIAAIKALREKTIPGIPGLEKVNAELDPSHSLVLRQGTQAWNSTTHPRRAALNSYAVGGVNAHVILEEYDGPENPLSEPVPASEVRKDNINEEEHGLFSEEELREINSVFRQVLGEDFPVTSPEASFADLGYSSVKVLELTGMLRVKLGIELRLGQIMTAHNAGAFLKLLRSALDKRPAGFRPLSDVVVFHEREDASLSTFIIPGMPGITDGYYELAEKLSAHGNVYGLQMKGTGDAQAPFRHVEEMARHNVELLKKVYNSKPVWLVAHSYGGLVAHEMLKQLKEEGISVQQVLLIDSYSGVLKTNATEKIAVFLLSVLNQLKPALPADVEREARKMVRKPRAEWPALIFRFLKNAGAEMSEELMQRLWAVYDASMNAQYKLSGKADVPATLICAKERLPHTVPGDLGWGNYFRHIEVVGSPGDHFSIVKEPHCSEWTSIFINTSKTLSI
jgi:3-oxoacyl-(acyl-carrier-protein) synthase/thioesterase domain-containing protein/acyl carrier protein